jgi:ribosome-binding factor A
MESRRQKQLSSTIKQDMSDLLQKDGANYYGAAFVSVTNVWVSPDLSVARVYVSVFNQEKPEEIVDKLNARVGDIRWRFGKVARHHLRKIPELEFFWDDSVEKMFKIDDLLKDL